MTYTVEIIPRERQNTSVWAGGTTTELAIFPKGSEYKARNFKWRLSSASVEVEESTFTSLPGVWRHIMIIDGEMELMHEGHHSALLKPFEQDSFSGSWTTRSIGKARDFNLMLSEECKGELEVILVGKGSMVEVEAGCLDMGLPFFTDAFFCATGAVVVIWKEEQYHLRQGDLLMIHRREADKGGKMVFQSDEEADSSVIRAKISYK